jgi:hypothetical protein
MKKILLVFLLISFSNCKKKKEKVQKEKKVVEKKIIEEKIENNYTEPEDYSVIEYKLPESNYVFKIKIDNINTVLFKNSFETKSDLYSVSENEDGYKLSLDFNITNPYERSLTIPIPYYFYITSVDGKWFTSSTTRHKKCNCKINNSTKVTNEKGQELWKISEGTCGFSKNCLTFKPNESKKFKIEFKDIIYGKIKKIAFHGFNLSWENPSYTKKQDKALIIDIEKKEIIGEKKF